MSGARCGRYAPGRPNPCGGATLEASSRDRQRTGLLCGAIFVVALGIRLVYWLDIRSNPFFDTPVIDAEYYLQMAQAFATTGASRAPFQMPPGYPLLLSLVLRLFGTSLFAAHLLQFLLGSASAVLTFLVARRVARRPDGRLDDTVGLVAAGFVATSKALLFLEGDLLATPLAVTLDLVALFFLVRWVQSGESRWDLGLAGIAFGLGGLVVPLGLAVVPFLALWIALRRRRPPAAVLFAALAALTVLPVSVRNLRSSGEFVLVSANGGINFWMGNNPDARHTAATRPGPEWRAMQELPLRQGEILSSSARDRWFWREGLRYWLRQPVAALRATAAKALLLLHDHEVMRDFDFYYFRDHFSRLLRFPGWNFALLLGLAVVGFFWARRRSAADAVLLLFVAGTGMALAFFFVTARYRAPLLPVLAVYAATGLVWILATARSRAWRRLAAPGLVGGLVYVFSIIDFFGVDRVDTVEAEYRIATTYEKRGELQDALLRYDAVLAREPAHPLAAARAGVCAQRLGRVQEAIDRYEALLERHPDYAEAAVNLATIAWQHGNREEAEHYFQVALGIDPYLAQAHASYGLFRLQTGDARGAVAELEKALAYDPTWDALRLDWVRALLAAGDTARARVEIERASTLLPDNGLLELLRGDVLNARGDTAGARAAWERGLQLSPSDPELRQRLEGRATP